MKQTLRLGRIAGISIGVHWSVLLIMMLLVQSLALVVLPAAEPDHPAWMYLLVALVATVLFLASLLAHELAHALVARHYQMRVERVTLWLLGGPVLRTPPTQWLQPRAVPFASHSALADSRRVGGRRQARSLKV